MPGGYDVQTIPLGGQDFGGNPLPAQGQFYAPTDKPPAQGSGPWQAYAPPAPEGGSPGGEQSAAGPWQAYTPPATEGKPSREFNTGEAAMKGAVQAATFEIGRAHV